MTDTVNAPAISPEPMDELASDLGKVLSTEISTARTSPGNLDSPNWNFEDAARFAGQAKDPATNAINYPLHYTSHPSGVECITITEWMNYNLGSALAYIWRCELKGNAIEDLEKAVWHLQREISRLKSTG